MVSGGGVEQVKFFVIARVSHTHPHFIELLPFDPLPSQMMGTSKLEEVEDTEAAKGVGTTNYILVDLAFGTGGFVRPGQRKVLSILLMLRRTPGGGMSDVMWSIA